jgi:putative transposase
MKLTVKCKLITDTKTKINAVHKTINQYNNITHTYFKILSKQHLGWSKKKLMVCLEKEKQVMKYYVGFPSGLRQSARDKAIEGYKSWVKTRGRKPKMKSSIRLDKRTYTLIKTDNKKYPYFITITMQGGRVKFPLGIGKERLKYFEDDHCKNKSAEIVEVDGELFINIVFEIPIKEIEKTDEFLGVDLGLTNIATMTCAGNRKTEFFSGLPYKKRLMQLREQYRGAETTKSKRLIGRKINRLNNDLAHKVSKKIVNNAIENKVSAIAFEELKQLKPKKKKMKKKTNFRLSMWMRRRIQEYTAYKAGLNGVPVVTIDPKYTSQRCPRCNHTERKNRRGILFSCKHCSYKNNADRIGSINIAQRYLGVFVGQKLPTNITHVNGWQAMIIPKGEGVANFVSSNEAYLQKQSFWRARERSSLDLFKGR